MEKEKLLYKLVVDVFFSDWFGFIFENDIILIFRAWCVIFPLQCGIVTFKNKKILYHLFLF